MAGTTERRRKVLYDLPAEMDGFKGGGHQRTAASLANTIRDTETRSIGLEGKWGSGKSTIVELAKKKLDEADNGRSYHVFTFDLWTNQNSSFRRAFLESLLAWLASLDPTQYKYVEAIQDRIRDKVVETRTVNVRTFSPFGIVVLVFLLALPWLYAWLSPLAFKDASLSQGSIAAIFALVVMAAWTAVATFRAHRGSRKEAAVKSLSWTEALSRTISMYTKDAETVHLTQNIREVDPTLTAFDAVLKDMLSVFQGSRRRIIIVFDNIDRLPNDRIIDAWADIRTVLSSSRYEDNVEKRLTVIVPYDRNHIVRAIYPDAKAEDLHKDDVFRKSFDTIYFVAPPVVSDAIQYFSAKLNEAIGSHFDQKVAWRVFKLFELSRGDETPTPRQVIAFINSIASLWEQWGDLIPLTTIGVYMIYRDKVDSNPGILRNPATINARHRELADDPDLDKNLAALAFNVEPQLAYQVLLHVKIEQAFTNDSADDVRAISAAPGFDVILPDVFSEENVLRWAKEAPTQFKSAARNIALLDSDEPSTIEAKKKLLASLPMLAPAKPEDWGSWKDLLSLYEIATPSEAGYLTSALAEWLHRGLPTQEDRAFEVGQSWLVFVRSMVASHVKHDTSKSVDSVLAKIHIPESDDFQIGAAYEASGTEIAFSAFKNGTAPKRPPSPALNKLLIDEPDVYMDVWPQLRHLVEDASIAEALQSVTNTLTGAGMSVNDPRFGSLVKTFNMLFVEAGRPLAMRKALINSGVLYHAVHALKGEGGEKEVPARDAALWTVADHFLGKVIPETNIQHPTLGDLSAARDYVRSLLTTGEIGAITLSHLVSELDANARLESWIEAASESLDTNGLVDRVVQAALLSDGISLPSAGTVVDHFDEIEELLGDKTDALLAVVGSERAKEEFSALDTSSVSVKLIERVAERSEPGWIEFLIAVDRRLIALEHDDWVKAFEDGGHALDVLRSRVMTSKLALPPAAFRDPLFQRILGVLQSAVPAATGFDIYIGALPAATRTSIPSDLLQQLTKIEVSKNGFDAGLASFPALLSSLPFEEEAITSVRKIIIPAIHSASDPSIAFLEQNKERLRNAIKESSPTSVDLLQEFIGPVSTNDEESVVETKRRFRKILGLPDVIEVAPPGSDEPDGATPAK